VTGQHDGDDARRLATALSAIRSLRARVRELERDRAQPVAIIGMGCRFPAAPDPGAYWRLLCAGGDAIRDIPADRWDVAGYYDPDPRAPGRMYCRRGGFLDDIAGFDASFFGISPREARRMDPQQRLLLEVSWEALEDAGLDPRSLQDSRTGVYVGISEAEYLHLLRRGAVPAEMHDMTGNALSLASGRLSHLLGLRGPSIALDTACSSALVAVHLAVASLRSGESDLALAGGVSLMLTPDAFIAMCKGGALAADGRCKPFDTAADGYGRGEGAGLVVLKRLRDALEDADPIHAVIRGSAVNQDGRTNGLTAPSGLAQQDVIRRALADAGLEPGEVGYVETHGTGTSLGDPIEAGALGAVFRERDAAGPVLIGTAKSNIGHLEAAAGMAGLIKTVLALQRRQIPPSLNFRRPSPHIPWPQLPVAVATELAPWPRDAPAAGVSSFGFSGTNAHVVLAAAPPPEADEDAGRGADRPFHILALSARTAPALRELAARHAAALREAPEAALADVCYTVATGRSAFPHRLAVPASSGAEAAEVLSGFAQGRRTAAPSGHAEEPPRVAFLFTGQGAQYAGMGRRVYQAHPGFRRTLDTCAEILRDHGFGEVPLTEALYPEPGGRGTGLLERTWYAQPAIFALEYALAELWRSWGIAPHAVLGHSTGEYAAACAAGALGVEDGLTLVALRARLIEEATSGGATAAVFAAPEQVAPVLDAHDGQLSLAGFNGPRETLIAGAAPAVTEALAKLKAGGLDGRLLKVPHAPHSAMIEPVLADFEAAAARIRFGTPRIAMISNVTGAVLDSVDAGYWRRHLREPVRFSDCVATLAGQDCAVMLEVGPQPVLQLLGRQNWTGPPVRWLSSLWEGRDDWSQLLRGLGELYAAGAPVDWAAFDRGYRRRRRHAPTYPFQRTRYWFTEGTLEAGTVPQNRPRAAAEEDSRREQILADLRQRIGAGLEMPARDVGPGTTFVDLGADSLLLMGLIQDICDLYGVTVGIGRLFDDLDTPAAVAAHLDRAIPDHRVPPPAAAAPPAPAAAASPAPAVAASPAPAAAASRAPVLAAPAVARAELTGRQQEHLDELLSGYRRRTRGSLRRAEEHRARRADTRMRSVRPETRPVSYPIIGERAEGARFRDIDGNEYVDLAMGMGVLLCGHNPGFVTRAVAGQLELGVQNGPVSALADEVAGLVCELTGMERLFFAVTGSDAVRGALRIAQAATGRSRFVMFSGSYHGQDDRVLAIPDIGGDRTESVPMAPGIAPGSARDALILTYGAASSLAAIEARRPELAGVLVEPVQSRNPALQPAGFLRDLRALTARLGIPLIFDEVITGFRVHPGGAQAHFGVRADIAAYGKVVGGGLPVGIVAGRAAYLDWVDGGAWADGPGPDPGSQKTYIGSTFEMHPLTMASARAMLLHLRAEGPALQQALNERTARLAQALNALFDAEHVPIRVLYFSSMFRFAWKGNASYAYQPLEIEVFHLHLITRGIYLWEGRTCFLSTAHTEQDIEAVVAAVRDTVAAMREGGFLPPATAEAGTAEAGTAEAGTAAAGTGTAPAGAVTDEQRALLALERRREPGTPQWTVAEDILLRGPLDLAALSRAVTALTGRHEALRTVFDARGGAVIRPAADVPVDLADLTATTAERQADAVTRWWKAALAEPFDLATGPLIRVAVLRLADQAHHLAMLAHHVISDGWTMLLLVQELAALYTAERRGLPAALGEPLQYREVAAWQERRRDHASRDLAYWRVRFGDGYPGTLLPAGPRRERPRPERPRPERPRPERSRHRGARVTVVLGTELCQAVRRAGQARQATFFMTTLAAYGLLVHQLTGQDDILIGAPQSGRMFRGSDSVAGYCAHFLPIRCRLPADATMAGYLREVRESVLRAFEHQEVPFCRLRDDAGDPGEYPLPLRVVFNLDRAAPCPEFDALTGEFQPVPAEFALVDLRLDGIETAAGLRLDWDYDTDLFDEATVRSWSDRYRDLLEEFARDPEQPVARIWRATSPTGR
jgi:acyl transferase domain-containing protein/glutamate-1-semialdehyde aminotransferase